MKKLLTTLALCLCVLLAASPAALAELALTDPGTMPVVTEPAEIDVFLYMSTNVGDMNCSGAK